jgi:rSAM/selenodomain-associated transferase 1
MDQRADHGLIVFVKEPVAGKVKKRLARDIGDQAACELYKAFVEDTVRKVPHIDARIQIHYSPAEALGRIQNWLGDGYEYVAQEGRDLGERMSNAFNDAFEQYERVVLIGSDCPDLPKQFVCRAFAILANEPAVIGPSHDGGYYLIGFSKAKFLEEIFDNIQWGRDHVLQQTLDRFLRKGVHPHLLAPWDDIDTLENLRGALVRARNTAFSDSRTIQAAARYRIETKV